MAFFKPCCAGVGRSTSTARNRDRRRKHLNIESLALRSLYVWIQSTKHKLLYTLSLPTESLVARNNPGQEHVGIQTPPNVLLSVTNVVSTSWKLAMPYEEYDHKVRKAYSTRKKE